MEDRDVFRMTDPPDGSSSFRRIGGSAGNYRAVHLRQFPDKMRGNFRGAAIVETTKSHQAIWSVSKYITDLPIDRRDYLRSHCSCSFPIPLALRTIRLSREADSAKRTFFYGSNGR